MFIAKSSLMSFCSTIFPDSFWMQMGNNLGKGQFECLHSFLMSEGKGLPCGDELCCAT